MQFTQFLAIIVPEVETITRNGKLMKIIAPTQCPSCNSVLERVKDQLFCRNTDDCSAQSSKRLQNFCKKLKIKGFGEATLEKLGLLNFNDILTLTTEYAESRGLSAHMSEKLVEVVNSRISLGISPNDFLAACSITLIGDGAMRKLIFDSVSNITYDMCKMHGLGGKAAENLLDWVRVEWPIYQELWEPTFVKEEQVVATLPAVCITGKLNDFPNRAFAKGYLQSLGFEVKPSVTKSIKYLISEDGKESSSYKKAINNGIAVITIKDLEEIYVN